MSCEFINQLSRLRKLSGESVDNINSFSPLNDYMHVPRVVESELKALLRRIAEKNDKILVLLCGSAGDGKSHLLSYLKNRDPEHLLDDFFIYNDATESTAPHLTSIDTLAELLRPFSDHFLNNGGHEKMIVAINLGVLNNFIDSKKGQGFSALKKYVEDSEIFSSFTKVSEYKEGSVFQHISFSDFHMYTLDSQGYHTEYLQRIFDKVFAQTEDNPFYQSFKKNTTNCTHCAICPVRHNYELMFDQQIRKSVINKLIEVIIKDKAVVTTREIMNFIYDILVHPDFSKETVSKERIRIEYFLNYLPCTTPLLMYELKDVSWLINLVRKHDHLQFRNYETDKHTLDFYTSNDISELYGNAVSRTPFRNLVKLNEFAKDSRKEDIKELVYRFIVRLSELKNEPITEQEREDFNEYVTYLYWQNKGIEGKKYIRKLYQQVRLAALKWNGDFGGESICIDDSNDQYWITEEVELVMCPAKVFDQPQEQEELYRFRPVLHVAFSGEGSSQDIAELTIDYSLFKLIKSINCGYRPSLEDKNSHPNFVSFVQQIIEFGKKREKIALISKSRTCDYVLKNDGFDFIFKKIAK